MGISTSIRSLGALLLTLSLAFVFPGEPRISAQEQAPDPVLTQVAEAQLDSLASRVGEKIKRGNRDEKPAKVLVFDFTWKSPEVSSRLGTLLADRFSEMLKANSSGVDVVDRRKLKSYLKDTWTDIADLRVTSACVLLAEELGAAEIIRANVVENEDRRLKVMVQATGSEPVLYDEAQFAISKEMEDMLSQPGPSYPRAPDPIPPEPDVLVMGSKGINGVSWPSCVRCAVPGFAELARKARVNGTVELSAMITATGEVTSIFVVKPLPLGVTQDAINAVRNWKFKPATRDGNPVAVRLEIQVTCKTF